MDALRRVVRKTPAVAKSSHKKLGEGWGEHPDPVHDGITFYMKYLGSTLVEELPADESYGDGISAKAVHTIVTMAKSVGKKLKKVSVTVSQHGIRMVDLVTKEVYFDLSIYRVSFCTADKNHDKVFAFIARNSINETMECHAFFCAKGKLAQAITLTVSQAFAVAQDNWDNMQNTSKKQKDLANHRTQAANNTHLTPCVHDLIGPISCTTGSSSASLDPFSVFPSPPQCSSKASRHVWQEFSDGEEDSLEDDFSKLAQNRGRRPLSFSTDLCTDDVDEGVEQYMDGQRCLEEFSRQKSIEDLVNL